MSDIKSNDCSNCGYSHKLPEWAEECSSCYQLVSIFSNWKPREVKGK